MRAPLRGVHVFLVVDDADSSVRLSAALERADALVSVAASIGAGLTALEAMRPDVLLADVGDADERQAAFITRVRRCRVVPQSPRSQSPRTVAETHAGVCWPQATRHTYTGR